MGKLSQREIGFTQGLMYACGQLAREGEIQLAIFLWEESNLSNDDVKYCDEYDVSALREGIPDLPQGETDEDIQ